MKKGLFILLLCGSLVISGCGGAKKDSSYPADIQETETQEETEMNGDFRSAKWGIDKESVRKLEGEPLQENDSGMVYLDEVATYPVDVFYNFSDGKLIDGLYTFTQTHSNDNLYYDDYKNLVKIYTQKYGEPAKQAEQWSDELYKGNKAKIGMAVSAGHVMFASFWETESTEVSVNLYGDNFKIYLTALYVDKNYESKVDTNGI